MTTGDLMVGALIALMVIGAIAWLWHERRKGRNSCGCNCPGCSRAPVLVTIEDEDSCDCCKKN